MRELLELNRYLHDFTAALWVCGSILIWLLCREIERTGAPGDARRVFQRLARKIALVTVPSLVITLASGGIRAMTFTRYEYVGRVTTSLTVILVVKHALFAVLIAWGIWIHIRSRSLGRVSGGHS